LTSATLDPGIIFASLAWFNTLRFPLMLLPRLLAGYADFKIAIDRIDGLMLAEEVIDHVEQVPDAEFAIQLDHASFKWDCLPPEEAEKAKPKVLAASRWSKKGKNVEMQKKDSESAVKIIVPENPVQEKQNMIEFAVEDLDLTILKGKLVAIVGSVGSGKSTILNSLVGETKLMSGTLKMSGTIGFAPQQAWIQNATVKENILFGQPYDHQRYLRAIHTCALERDLELFPDGDSTEIGERGINLSGGQKQR
jgi:ABC-type multidrug transport system fused ATPase/permease subunit